MTDWTSVETLLTAAVLALAWPREDELLIPERRDWRGWVRGLLPRARRQREEAGGREAEEFVTALTTDLPVIPAGLPRIPIRPLPSEGKVYRPERVTRSANREQAQMRPPWHTMENPWLAPEPQVAPPPRRRAPKDPPTIVMEVMRPAVAADLGVYLKALPAYDDAPGWSLRAVAAQPAVALGAPDHDDAPQDVDGDQPEEDHLAPLEPGVADVEGQEEPAREQRPGD